MSSKDPSAFGLSFPATLAGYGTESSSPYSTRCSGCSTSARPGCAGMSARSVSEWKEPRTSFRKCSSSCSGTFSWGSRARTCEAGSLGDTTSRSQAAHRRRGASERKAPGTGRLRISLSIRAPIPNNSSSKIDVGGGSVPCWLLFPNAIGSACICVRKGCDIGRLRRPWMFRLAPSPSRWHGR